MIIGKYNKSVILTYIGTAIAFAGIALATESYISVAMICLIFAGICDLFDGVIARRCKRNDCEKEFGIQIDSLADTIDFLAFPTVLGLHLLNGIGILRYPILLLYILCGIIRLAWFNTSAAAKNNVTNYDGLPVTYSALIFPLLWLILGSFDGSFAGIIWAIAYTAVAILFVINIKIVKPRGMWYIVFGILAVIVTLLIFIRDIL